MEEFIGFNDIIEGFNKRVDKGTLSHAHLIVGPDGIGKSILARKFALKILNKEIDKDYIDIIHYRAKKASFGVDDVRGIIEEIMKRPYEGDKKVVIIHEGNKLTIQAQNALLKTIEEPPKGVYIILLTDSIELMLDTIKSRCQIYKLTPLSKDEVNRYISRLGNFDENKVVFKGNVKEYVENIALGKAIDVQKSIHEDAIIIAADTIVTLDNKILGKPKDGTEAFSMLKDLSERTHNVYSGIVLINTKTGKIIKDSLCTEVKFSKLKDEEIIKYIESKEPFDKAGAYGIQGKGGIFVEEIKGCYYNVVGLPLNKLKSMMDKIV